MKSVAARLPTILGATAGLVVASIGILVQLPPQVCAMRSVAGFAVCAAFGIIIRFLLAESTAHDGFTSKAHDGVESLGLILPGTPVGKLLAEDEHT